MKRRSWIAIAALLSISATPFICANQAQAARAFFCERIPLTSVAFKEFRAAHAHTKNMGWIIDKYTQLWEFKEIERRCTLIQNGQHADTRCLQGKQDFDAIKAMIPSEYFKMDNGSLRTKLVQLDENRTLVKQRIRTKNACIRAGVWRGKIKKVE